MRSSARFTSESARYTYANRTCARWEKSAGAYAPASKAARNSRSLDDSSCFIMASLTNSTQQTLRDLHGIQRRALAQLIAGDEQAQRPAARIADILADAPDQHVVAAARIDRHRKVILFDVVDNAHARGVREDRTRFGRRQSLFELDVERDAVRAQHGHAHAGRGHAQIGYAEDLAGLLHDLGFFFVVAGLRVDLRVVREHVEGVGMRQHLRRERTALEKCPRRLA